MSKDEYSAYEKAVTDVAKWGSRSGKDYSTGNPLAPFVTDTNAWTKLGLKVALKEAVAQGIDKIAWTTGEQQNERYDLSKQVDEIGWQKNENGTYNITPKKDGSVVGMAKRTLEMQLSLATTNLQERRRTTKKL